ncbi:MAG: methyltransferase domain-containing protein, partial [bacterium]|nr:methyltransferase domain-containing protein [bacterium]
KPGPGPIRLHVGSGMERLEGWVNIDIQRLPEVDYALDVTRGFPFANVERIYAEHFLEHLPVGDALDFLLESNRILAPEGWIRLSTPNLDWVWSNVYRPPGAGEDPEDPDRVLMGLHANRAFYAWGHRFLWNRELLGKALRVTGFRDIRWCGHGESPLEAFRGIERHETYDDTPEVPHVLIAEGRKGPPRPDELHSFHEQLQAEFLRYR